MPKINLDINSIIKIIMVLLTVGSIIAVQAMSTGENRQKLEALEMNFQSRVFAVDKKIERFEQTREDVVAMKEALKAIHEDLQEIKRNTRRR